MPGNNKMMVLYVFKRMPIGSWYKMVDVLDQANQPGTYQGTLLGFGRALVNENNASRYSLSSIVLKE